MPFDRPDLPTLIARAGADLADRIPGADATLRRSVLWALARMHAGAVHGLYGYLDWLAGQLLPDTAEAEHLARWASMWGITRKAATFAGGLVSLPGTDGAVIPAGALLQRQDGAEYATTAEASVAEGSAMPQVRASVAGAAGNAVAGTRLSLVSPIAGVQSSGVVGAAGLAGGADIESDDGLRARLLARLRRPPQGGTADDYEAWALAVPGVTRCWVSPAEMGAGTVVLRVMMDDSYPDGLPQAADLETIWQAVDAVRPVGGEVFVLAPVPLLVPINVRVTPDTAQVRAAVEAELRDLFDRAEPGLAILLSHIREAISQAAGEQDHVLLSPSANIAPSAGELARLGAITWED